MKKKKLKWCLLFILFFVCLFIIPATFSKYVKSFNRKITLNVRKPNYQVVFNPNTPLGRTVVGTMPNQQFTYGTEQPLNSNNYTITNCVFLGWNTKADGTGTSYTDGQSVNNLSSTENDIINLYAQWKQYYNVIFDSDEGTPVVGQTVLENTTVMKPEDPTKTNYTFKSWQLNGVDYDFDTPVTADITLKAKWLGTSTLFDGIKLSAKLKSLANNGSPISISDAYKHEDTNTKAIKIATEAQYEAIKNSLTDENNLVSMAGSTAKTYAWFDSSTGTTYFYSDAGKIYMNADSQRAFTRMINLTDISALAYFDTSNVTDMNRMLQFCNKLEDLSPLKDWDVSKVTDMTFMFGHGTTSAQMSISDKSLESLKEWDVSSVITFYQMFKCCKNITTLKSLAKWKVSSATNFDQMFNYCGLTDATDIIGWDVRNGTSFSGMLNHNDGLSISLMPIFTLRPGTWNASGTYTPTPTP